MDSPENELDVSMSHLMEIMTITRSKKPTAETVAALQEISRAYDNKNPELFHYIAWVYFEAEEYMQAFAYISTALVINPNSPTYIRMLLVLLDRTGLNDAEDELFRIYAEKYKKITGEEPDRNYSIPKKTPG